MRKVVFILLLLVSIITSAQEEMSALDKVAKETCEYFEKNQKEISKLDNQEKLTKLGLKMFALYDKYKEELNKEGIEFDLSKGDESGRAFGEKVGLSMAQFCPDILVALSREVNKREEKNEEDFVEGVITSVKGDEINTVMVKDISGKSQKFLWLSNFKGSDRLIENRRIKRQKVKVYYINIEVYSPKLQEYVIRKQITRIDYL